jgi:hypothetical protein
MANMKYIIFKSNIGWKLPFIFPSTISHKEFANKFPDMTPISAGNFSLDSERCSMSGESTTLGIKSLPEDIDTLKINACYYS